MKAQSGPWGAAEHNVSGRVHPGTVMNLRAGIALKFVNGLQSDTHGVFSPPTHGLCTEFVTIGSHSRGIWYR